MEITKEHIFLDTEYTDKVEVFNFIAEKAVELGITGDRKQLFEDLQKREEEYSTGLQDGFAIPHAKSKAVLVPSLFFIRNNAKVEWETLDDSEVTYIFSLLVPEENKENIHLQMLANLATCLIEEEFRYNIKTMNDTEELVQYIQKSMEV